MRASKEIVTAVGTLALAVGIGFVMQSTDEAKDRYDVRTAPKAVKTDTVKGASIMPELRKVQLTSAINKAPRPIARSSAVDNLSATPVKMSTCGIEAETQVMPGAMVQIILDAPCKPNERLIVHHSGLMFTDITNAEGNLTTTVPALAQEAVFIIAFESGRGTVIETTVEDMASYNRAVLQWSGAASGFELHALEFGADYGTRGHIWSGAEQSVQSALREDHGFVVPLGDPDVAQPLLAEVYTYPAEEGPVDLRVETEIHAMNCGLDIEVQSIQYDSGNLRSEEVVLSIPDCSVMGDLLVLSSLMDKKETTLASR